ncbi:outer membrane beta-barrel protein [Mucilaginibacter sp. PAMB04274]|uniref:outer membrane beta-barrel protein n=1 Tax=Mucilaginibacter sp. PAMB04274 TaxID=3138568 RepID=UPI0031F65D47
MKNSAWYSKLWRSKLDKLPVKSDAGAAWTVMQQRLDAHLPVNPITTAAPAAKSLIAKIITMAGYVLPAAAMIGTATWFAVKQPAKQKAVVKVQKKYEYRSKGDSAQSKLLLTDSSTLNGALQTDSSIGNIQSIDSIPASYNNLKSWQDSADESITTSKNNSANSLHTPASLKEAHDKLNLFNKTKAPVLKGTYDPNSKPGNSERAVQAGGATQRRLSGSPYSSRVNNKQNSINAAVLKTGAYKDMESVFRAERIGTGVKENYEELKSYPLKGSGASSSQSAGQDFLVVSDESLHSKITGNRSLLIADGKPELKTTAINDKSTAAKTKSKRLKPQKEKTIQPILTPTANYGFETGINVAGKISGFYVGVAGNYALTNRWVIGAALRYNSPRTLSGSYTHPSFFQPDSSSAFSINDSRKLQVIDLPLTLGYRVNNFISLKAGAVVSFAGKQSSISTRLGTVAGFRDTLRRSKTIDSVFKSTVVSSKVNLGFTAGMSITIKQFNIDARYLALPAYKVRNSMGGYTQSYSPFQIGISYWLKSGKK